MGDPIGIAHTSYFREAAENKITGIAILAKSLGSWVTLPTRGGRFIPIPLVGRGVQPLSTELPSVR